MAERFANFKKNVWGALRLAVPCVFFALPAGPVWAAGPGATVTIETYRAEVASAERLAAACGGAAAACDPGGLPAEGKVSGPGKLTFHAGWNWLREAVSGAKTASATDRATAMREAGEHLGELAAEAGGAPAAGEQAGFRQARAAADAVLARGEFQAANGPSWLDRQVARAQDWILRLLLGMTHLGQKNPWLAPLIEWSCFLLAAGGLLFFVRRTLARQALRIALGENAAAPRNGRDATDWAQRAEERGAAGEWREGIHCIFWAAVVSLETRRAWRENPTRTPREYVRLLRPGSEAQRALRELTHRFERVWYGHAAATEAEFRAARASLAAIAAADLRRSEAGGVDPAAAPVQAAAPVGVV